MFSRAIRIFLASVLTAGFLAFTPTSPVTAVNVNVSGTITAGGVAVPAGSYQVVFIPYAFSACNTGSGLPTGANTVVPVGPNGQFSVNLPRARYRVAFRAMSSAPSNSVGGWYSNLTTDGTPNGTAEANCLLVDASPVVINHTRTGTRLTKKGSLLTDTNGKLASGIVSMSSRKEDWFWHLDGAGSSVTGDATWELGVQPNVDTWLQVKVPATVYGQVFCGVPSGNTFELVPATPAANVASPAACTQEQKITTGSTSVSNIALKLPEMGVLKGRVTGVDSSVAQTNEVCVTAYKTGGDASNWYSQGVGQACTDASGNYEISVPYDTNLTNNASLTTKYKLYFSASGANSPYKSRWYASASLTDSYLSADSLPITSAAKTQIIDVSLPVGKSIRGVARTTSGQPIVGARVTAMLYSDNFWGPMGVRGTVTGSDGSYFIGGLEPGRYTVQGSHPEYGTQWLGGGGRDSATEFTIASGDSGATGKDLAFSPGNTLSGTITLPGSDTAQVCVSAYKVSESTMGWGDITQTRCFVAPGNWSLNGIQPGDYKVRFDVRDGDYKSKFYGDTIDFSAATTITVGQSNFSDINTSLEPSKSISLKLMDGGGSGVTNVCVIAYKLDDSYWGGKRWYSQTCTSDSGKYKLRGIDPGDYKIEVITQGTDLRGGFYSEAGKLTTEAATSIVPVQASDTHLDLGVSTLYAGPLISLVLNSSGTPVPGVCVSAYRVIDTSGWGPFAGSACSASNGSLALRGLPEGTYQIQVNATGNHRGGWLTSGNTTSKNIGNARQITLSEAAITVGTVSLTVGSRAEGVIKMNGTGVPHICVNAFRDTGSGWGEYEGTSCTASTGAFSITGLDPTGNYRFQIQPNGGDFKQGFINNANEIQPTPNGVNTRQHSTRIDIGDVVITTAPSIKGTVVVGEQTPEPNVCITAIELATNNWAASSCSLSNGKFALRGLTIDARYKLTWWTPNKNLMSGWYNSQSYISWTGTLSEASEIEVPQAGVNNLIIRMKSGSIITGTVSTGICVAAWTTPLSQASERTNASAYSCGNSEGRFELRGLAANTPYYVEAFKKDGTSVTQTSPSGNTVVNAGDDIVVTAS